jgi:hypothetical protein
VKARKSEKPRWMARASVSFRMKIAEHERQRRGIPDLEHRPGDGHDEDDPASQTLRLAAAVSASLTRSCSSCSRAGL